MTNEILAKILGSGILIFAALYFSYIKISASRNKIREISAFIDIISEIKNGIYHFSKPLPEIFSNYNNDYFENNGFLKDITQFSARDVISKYSFVLNNESAEIIKSFFSKIGESYVEDEINLCGYTLERLTQIKNSMISDDKNIGKLYRTIPILAALSVILVLI